MTGGRSAFRKAAVLILALSMAGCSGGDGIFGGGGADRDENLEGYTAEQIFERGEYELSRNRADDAAFYFGEIERLYPYSAWAQRALIMQAFSYHQDRDYENSRAAAQRFIDFYPADEDAAYAAYLLALSY